MIFRFHFFPSGHQVGSLLTIDAGRKYIRPHRSTAQAEEDASCFRPRRHGSRWVPPGVGV